MLKGELFHAHGTEHRPGLPPPNGQIVNQPTGIADPARSDISTPLCFTTALVEKVWGGQSLRHLLQHSLPREATYGEAWDISSLPDHISRVADGTHIGRTLTEVWNTIRHGCHCDEASTDSDFPLLIKWLDCQGWLSVQVHPNDTMARAVLGQRWGKSEAWVVIEAEPTSRIFAGLRPGISQGLLMYHVNKGTIHECLHSFTPRRGDCIALPAGTIHAAGGGLLIAEVQQSSNATFRLFDWNRTGPEGLSRSLQIDLALDAINWSQGAINPILPQTIECTNDGVREEFLVELPAFSLSRYMITQTWPAPHSDILTIWMVLEGAVRLTDPRSGEVRDISRGRTVLIPANTSRMFWTPIGSEIQSTLLCIRLPR